MYHDGRLGGRSKPRKLILESLREAGREDLLNRTADGTSTKILLGRLPAPHRITPTNTRVLVANLLYYGMIRHTLHRGLPYSFRD